MQKTEVGQSGDKNIVAKVDPESDTCYCGKTCWSNEIVLVLLAILLLVAVAFTALFTYFLAIGFVITVILFPVGFAVGVAGSGLIAVELAMVVGVMKRCWKVRGRGLGWKTGTTDGGMLPSPFSSNPVRDREQVPVAEYA